MSNTPAVRAAVAVVIVIVPSADILTAVAAVQTGIKATIAFVENDELAVAVFNPLAALPAEVPTAIVGELPVEAAVIELTKPPQMMKLAGMMSLTAKGNEARCAAAVN
jgi:hypothetical protein